MNVYTAYLGLRDKNADVVTATQEHFALQRTAQIFGGYTLTRAEGGWNSESGLRAESSLRIEVVTTQSLDTARRWAEDLRRIANQHYVLLTAHQLTHIDYVGIPDDIPQTFNVSPLDTATVEVNQ